MPVTKHALDIRWVIAAAAGGAILGDNIGFWVGREFGEPLLAKWGHLIGLDLRKRMLGRYLFSRYGVDRVFRAKKVGSGLRLPQPRRIARKSFVPRRWRCN